MVSGVVEVRYNGLCLPLQFESRHPTTAVFQTLCFSSPVDSLSEEGKTMGFPIAA